MVEKYIKDENLPWKQWWGQKGDIDISLVEDDRGRVIMHAANCKIARAAADAGRPVYTLLGCKGLPDNVRRCDCIEKEFEAE